jgi:hypothetical protein
MSKNETKKSKPAKKGTKQNPFPNPRWDQSADDLEPGWYRTFVVEKYDSEIKQWEPQEWTNTLKQAQTELEKCERYEASSWVDTQKRRWTHENTHHRQTNSITQINLSAKTTDEELAAELEKMKATRDRLKENPPAKMPKFDKKDAPISRYRIIERTINVTTKTVMSTTGRKGKGKK